MTLHNLLAEEQTGMLRFGGARMALDVVCIEHSCQAKGDEACLFELLSAS